MSKMSVNLWREEMYNTFIEARFQKKIPTISKHNNISYITDEFNIFTTFILLLLRSVY